MTKTLFAVDGNWDAGAPSSSTKDQSDAATKHLQPAILFVLPPTLYTNCHTQQWTLATPVTSVIHYFLKFTLL